MRIFNFECKFMGLISRKYGFFLCLIFPAISWAQVGPPYCAVRNIDAIFGSQNFTMGADQIAVGQQIGTLSQVTQPTVFYKTSSVGGYTACNPYRSWVRPLTQRVLNVSYKGSDGKSYDVYQTSIPGIGYAVGVADTNSNNYTPVTGDHETTVLNSTASGFESVGFKVQVRFIVTGPLQTGSYSLSNEQFLVFTAKNRNRSERTGSPTIRVTANFEVKAATCTLASPNQITLALAPVKVQDVAALAVGEALQTTRSQRLVITATCQKDVHLHATVSDANDSSSTASYLVNTPGQGRASGVGVQLSRGNDSNVLISMGPPTSNADNTNSFNVGSRAATDGATKTFSVAARYVKTSPTVTAGSVQSLGHVFFSYR